jgi:hypothetical protein
MARFDILGLQYFTDGGELLGGGKLNFYETGTTTRKNTFSDSAMTIANTNPVTLDADGRAPNIFFSGLAKCVLTNSTGVVLETKDPVGDDFASNNGFPEWAADVTYSFNQPVTASDGYIYTSLVNNNIGNDPISSPTDWQLLAKTIGIPNTPNGNVLVIDTSEDFGIGSVTQESLQSLIFIQTQTISAAATVDFTDLSTYSQYLFVFKNIYPATNNAGINMRTSSDNGATFDSGVNNYLGGESSYMLFTGARTDTSSGTSAIIVGSTVGISNAIGTGFSGQLFITKQASEETSFTFSGGLTPSTGSNFAINQGFGRRDSTVQINAVRFFASSGNITSGSISVYGVRTS